MLWYSEQLCAKNLLKVPTQVTFSHSFWRHIYCLFKRLLLRGAPSLVTDKEEGLKRDVVTVSDEARNRTVHSPCYRPSALTDRPPCHTGHRKLQCGSVCHALE